MALSPGRYIITNVRTRNRAALENGNDRTDLVSSSGNHPPFREEWEIAQCPNGQYLIRNRDHRSIVMCEHQLPFGLTHHVFGWNGNGPNPPHHPWEILRVTGNLPQVFIIRQPASANMCWMADIDHGSSIKLAEYRQDDRFHWTFNIDPVFLPQISLAALGGSDITDEDRKKAGPLFDAFCRKRVPGAAYDSQERYPPSKCLKGTRVTVRENITRWRSNRPEAICWLKGPAGSGKSSIAYSLARDCQKRDKVFAGSFFFRRGQTGCSDIAGFVPTVAYQLFKHARVPGIQVQMLNAIHSDPDIHEKSRPDQFMNLIVKPLCQCRSALIPLVLIVDALDECDEDSVDELALILAQAEYPLRVFVTSRSDGDIQTIFRNPVIENKTYCLALEDYAASDDIRLFFQDEFSTIYAKNRHLMQKVPQPWPSRTDLDKLVTLSQGLFIFASTVVRLVGEGDEKKKGHGRRTYPAGMLQKVLLEPPGLDHLYKGILLSAAKSSPDDFRAVVGTIILAEEPLSLGCLQHLLRLERDIILTTLHKLHSIVMVPEDDDQPIRIFHTSLRDYLIDEKRSGDLFIDPGMQHASIAFDCANLAMAIPTTRGDEAATSALLYALLRWPSHLAEALESEDHPIPEALYNDLIQFLTNSIVYSWNTYMDFLRSGGMLEYFIEEIEDLPPILTSTRMSLYQDKFRQMLMDFRQLLSDEILWELWTNEERLTRLVHKTPLAQATS